ncbi:MAG: hypothetical protein IJQ43_08530 [Oscillospiraceae bacterium]|nr:hypothetical protein [Oscillospiraceae bacterium]
MNVKVDCNMLAAAETELRDLSTRLQAITDEIAAAQRALLSTGDTFRQEALAMESKRRVIEQESAQVQMLSDAVSRLIEMYAECERRQQEESAARVVGGIAELSRAVRDVAYVSAEQFTKSYGDLIGPLVGVLE